MSKTVEEFNRKLNKLDSFIEINSLPNKDRELYMKIMLSTLDVVNEWIDKDNEKHEKVTPIVFCEAVAYKAMLAEVWTHMKNDEFYDVLGDKTWKKVHELKND